jgi:hypothetical protein
MTPAGETFSQEAEDRTLADGIFSPKAGEITPTGETFSQETGDGALADGIFSPKAGDVTSADETISQEAGDGELADPTISPKAKDVTSAGYAAGLTRVAGVVGRGSNGGRWLVSARFGSSGGLATPPVGGAARGEAAADYATGQPRVSASYERPAMIVPAQYEYVVPVYTSQNSLPPLSFGVLARRRFGGHAAVESGLVYSYLSTTFESAAPVCDAHLALHYVGIPVNLIGYIYDGARWDVYTLVGATVEKGVRSVFEQRRYEARRVVSHVISTNIDGLQWSVGGSLGLSYRIRREWSVYFEPRVSYYFDSGQPVSMRTEHPLTFSMGVGVRYEFW